MAPRGAGAQCWFDGPGSAGPPPGAGGGFHGWGWGSAIPGALREFAAERLPDGTDALVVGGDFPQVHAERLTANTALPADTGWQPFATATPNQRQVSLEVWEQAGAVAA